MRGLQTEVVDFSSFSLLSDLQILLQEECPVAFPLVRTYEARKVGKVAKKLLSLVGWY